MVDNTQDRSESPSRAHATPITRDFSTSSSTGSIFRRSWYVMTDMLSPFSPSALSKLPDMSDRNKHREMRADRIPDSEGAAAASGATVHRDYNTISSVPVRIPKKIATPIKVEGKVWFANERTWLSYLNMAILLATLSLALLNASEDAIARRFAFIYALISVAVLVYGWYVYQTRITMIRKRDPGHFDQVAGPVIISAFLFFAVLSNFIIRVREFRRKGIPIPDE